MLLCATHIQDYIKINPGIWNSNAKRNLWWHGPNSRPRHLGKLMYSIYSTVKDSSADLGVNSKIVQIKTTVKAVSTKISKFFFCIFVNFFVFLRENKKVSFFIFWIFKLKQPYAKPELLLIMGLFWTLSFQRSNPHYCL